jgi:iron complex transport system ATP-binding protein
MLAVSHIHLNRQNRPILLDMSLTVQPGQMVMIIGPNGAGKSTLLHVLAGALTASAGLVTLDSQPIIHWSPAVLAQRRAVLTQQVQLAFALSVRQVVQLGLSPWTLSRSQQQTVTEQVLSLTGLSDLAQCSYPQLSGGQQQRVHIARVLLQIMADGASSLQGRYLLLDEPLAALDVHHQQVMLRVLTGLKQRGLGIACVIHDLNLASLYADHLLVLQHGRTVFSGPPQALAQSDVMTATYAMDSIQLSHPESGCPQWLLQR